MQFKHLPKKQLRFFKTLQFPKQFKMRRNLTHRCVIGVGGNIGDSKRLFEKLLVHLKASTMVDVVQTSIILKNPPFGYDEQAFFYNTIVEVQTYASPHALLCFLLHTEKRFGRKRSFDNAPRTLDLDMIFYDDKIIKTKRLQVPHPQWAQRESVVIPLHYLEYR